MKNQVKFRHQSAYAEIILLRKKPKNHKLKIFVVEGITDKVLFENLLRKYREKYKIIPAYREHYIKIPCSGTISNRQTPIILSQNRDKMLIHRNNKGEVIRTIKNCIKNSYNYVYGVVDADFMHISGKIKKVDNLLYTTFHDIDIEIFIALGVLENFLQDGFPDKQLQVNLIRNLCLKIATEFGKYKYILERRKIHSKVRHEKNFLLQYFLTIKDSKISLNCQMIEEHIQDNWNIYISDIKNEIVSLNLNKKDPKMIANGHDFFTVFWIMKEENLYNLAEFPQNSEFLNLNHFECEKILKLCYVQTQMFEKNFWNRICAIILE